MKHLSILVIPAIFIFSFACTLIQRHKTETQSSIIFIDKNFKEYAWKEYDKDSVRLSKPVRTIKDMYTAEYRLSGQELIIYKVRSYKDDVTKEVQFTASLSQQQTLNFFDALHKLNPDSVMMVSSNAHVADGFDLNVIVQQDGKATKLNWSNRYVPELVVLLSITNQLSPDKYKFYTNEAGFIQELKKLSTLDL